MKKLVVLAIAAIAVSSAAGAAGRSQEADRCRCSSEVRASPLRTAGPLRRAHDRTADGSSPSYAFAVASRSVATPPGYFDVPVISLDGATAGVSHDGKKLVLATSAGGIHD